MEYIVQGTTIQIKGYWRFLNSIHLYMKKKTKAKILFFHKDSPTLAYNLSDIGSGNGYGMMIFELDSGVAL